MNLENNLSVLCENLRALAVNLEGIKFPRAKSRVIMKDLISKFKNEDGSTLVETLVAMAILVSVLLPASMFLGYMANTSQNKEKIIALGLAQLEMESVLESENYINTEKERDDKWLIKNTIAKEDELIQIEILVYRKNRTEPILNLTTERLMYDD